MPNNKAMGLAGYFSVLVLTAGFAGAGELEFHTVDFHQFHNQNLQVILDRIASPGISPKGDVTFLDVPFFIPASGLNMWHSFSVIGCLFLGSDCGSCPDASDVNDDGAADLSDPISLLTWRFLDGPQPNAPFPDCGVDPAKDALEDCLGFSGCSG